MNQEKNILHHCLYFTANSLARVITRMAEEEFRKTGLSPSHAFLMMLVAGKPGIGQKELGLQLHLAPSTVTRFVDALAHRGFLVRQSQGKTASIFPTPQGKKLLKPIEDAWKDLHERYSAVLGLEQGDELTERIDLAAEKLENFG